jgi:hypothetical protein
VPGGPWEIENWLTPLDGTTDSRTETTEAPILYFVYGRPVSVDGYVSRRGQSLRIGPIAAAVRFGSVRVKVLPGTGFEPVCLSAARFKFDLTPSRVVRHRSWQSRQLTKSTDSADGERG